MSQRAKNRRQGRRWAYVAEILEERTLLSASSETFTGPSLSGLIAEALKGKNTSAQAINQMVGALQSQLNSGPLADLQSGAVGGNGFIQEVEGLEASYAQDVDKQLLPRFKNVATILQLQGQRIVADLVSLNQQESVGLISSTALAASAQAAIGTLSSGPITALNTPLSAFATVTQTVENNLKTVVQGLGSSATTPLTVDQAALTLAAEAEAYRADVHAGAQVTSPSVSAQVDAAVTTLEAAIDSVVKSGASASTAQTELTTAINTFDTAVLDTTGIFGPQGSLARRVSNNGTLPTTTVDSRPSTTTSAVSGTEQTDGTATLTAKLSSASGGGISGALVDFTLNGAFAGIGVTDSSGVATLAGVTIPAGSSGTTGTVAAAFLGTSSDRPSSAGGAFTAVQQATTLGSVSGTATFGGTATLTSTLTSTTTGKGLSGATVDFTLDGVSVGSAVTDANGVATLAGVATSDAPGTHTGAVVASFAGNNSDQAAADASGNLVVSQAGTSLGTVSGAATFGGTATLTATLTSSATGLGVAGQTVSFTLDGTAVGTAVTNASGVATLSGVATSDSVGTHTGAVVASFAGTTDYQAAANATGDLVVSQTATSLTSVSGSASSTASPEQATLTATLTAPATGKGVSGQTVNFTLDGTPVGSAVTDANGVATLAGVNTTDAAGTHTGVVVASYAGNTDYMAAANGSGDLVVSPAPTALSAASATAAFGGTATLTATLKTGDTNEPLAGKTVSFTLDGTPAGTAVTNSSGVATLTGVATSDPVGTHTGVVVASYAGDSTYTAATNATGNLVVSQAGTTLASVSGAASSTANPEQATLTATLTSSATGKGVQGETVSFTLDGTSVGTALTDSNGVATLGGVITSDSAGTHTGVVIASYGGSTNYSAAATASGDLVVS